MIKYFLIKSVRKDKKYDKVNKDVYTYKIQPVVVATSFLAERASEFMKEKKKTLFKSPLRLEILGYSGTEKTCIKLTGDKKYILIFMQELAVHEEFNTHWYWREIDKYDAAYELKWL